MRRVRALPHGWKRAGSDRSVTPPSLGCWHPAEPLEHAGSRDPPAGLGRPSTIRYRAEGHADESVRGGLVTLGAQSSAERVIGDLERQGAHRSTQQNVRQQRADTQFLSGSAFFTGTNIGRSSGTRLTRRFERCRIVTASSPLLRWVIPTTSSARPERESP